VYNMCVMAIKRKESLQPKVGIGIMIFKEGKILLGHLDHPRGGCGDLSSLA
jgi:hypothetical protein